VLAAGALADDADQAFLAANSRYEKGDCAGAAPLFKAFLERFAKDERAPIAAYRVGQCYGKLESFGEAALAFDRCWRQYPDARYADVALFNKGYYHFRAEQWQPSAAAYADYTRVGKNAALRAKAWYWRAEGLLKLNRPEDAAGAYESFLGQPAEVLGVPDVKELVPFARHGAGVGYYSAQQWEKAVGAFRKLVEQHPDAASADEALFYGAGALAKLNRLDEAVAWYQRLADQYGKSNLAPEALGRISALETGRGREAQAKAAADRLARDYPEFKALAGEARFRVANARLAAKDWEAAEKLFREALDGASGEVEAAGLLGLGEARFGQRKWADAEAAYVLLLDKHADDKNAPRAQVRLCEVRLQQSKWAEAEAAGRKYLERWPNGADAPIARYNLALAIHRQNRGAEAMALFEAVVAADPKSEMAAPVLLELGRFALEAKRTPDARRAYETFLKFHAARREALGARWGLVQVEDAEGDAAGTLKACRALVDAAPEDPLAAEALAKMIELHRKLGQEEKAQLVGQELRRRFPGSKLAARSLLSAGYEHFNARRYPEAIIAFEAFLRDYGKDESVSAALANLGASYYLAGAPADHFRKAADVYLRLAKEFPDAKGAEDALYWAGRALLESGDDRGGANALLGFVKARGEHGLAPKARVLAAKALGRAGRAEEAAQVLGEAVAAATDPAARAEVRYELAWVLLDAGRKDAAWEAFAGVIKDKPESELAADAEFRLCGRELERGEYKAAVAAYRKWLDSHPTHKLKPRARYNLAYALEQAQDFVAAAHNYGLAEKELDDAEMRQQALYHLAYCRFRAADFPEALKAFDAFDRQFPQGKLRPEATFYRGQVHSAQRNWVEAERIYRQLIRDWPSHELTNAAQFNLGVALQNQSKYLPAAEAYEPLTQPGGTAKPPGSELVARASLRRGECLFGLLKYQDAVAPLTAAEASGIDDIVAPARYWLGRCAQGLSDSAKAKAWFEKVVANHPKSDWAEHAKRSLAAMGG
jgi:TolA-binding protein